MSDKNWQFEDLIRRGLQPGETPYWESQTEGWKAAPATAGLTATELSYLSGVTSAIQGQIDGKQPATPAAVQQDLSGAGAVTLTEFYTAWTTTSTDAATLADGTVVGQTKKVKLVADGGDGTLTFNTDATIVFADVGDYAVLLWDGDAWVPIELGNDADGSTAPAYTPAS